MMGCRRLRKDLAAIVAAHEHIGRAIDAFARMRSRESFEIGLDARNLYGMNVVLCGNFTAGDKVKSESMIRAANRAAKAVKASNKVVSKVVKVASRAVGNRSQVSSSRSPERAASKVAKWRTRRTTESEDYDPHRIDGYSMDSSG